MNTCAIGIELQPATLEDCRDPRHGSTGTLRLGNISSLLLTRRGTRGYSACAIVGRAWDPADANGCIAYRGCDQGFPVVWCQTTGGLMQPRFAAAAIWQFFSQF